MANKAIETEKPLLEFEVVLEDNSSVSIKAEDSDKAIEAAKQKKAVKVIARYDGKLLWTKT